MGKITNAIKYEYQILRYRHDVVSGEFVNIGIAFFDVENRVVRARVVPNQGRIAHFFGTVSSAFLLKTVKLIEYELNQIGKQLESDAFLNPFTTITDLTSTVLPINDNGLFFSDVSKGWHFDHDKAFNATFDRLIGQYTQESSEPRHDDHFVWKKLYKHYFDAQNLTNQFKTHDVKTQSDIIAFEHAAKNGSWHCLQPISFDLKKGSDIKEKIYRWSGIVAELQTAEEPHCIYLLSLMPADVQLQQMIEQKFNFKKPNLTVCVIHEDEGAEFAQFLKKVIEQLS
jgi:Protein of unknown function (DUF3037)